MSYLSSARVATDRPGRYGKQLVSHFSRKIAAEWDAEAARGTMKFDSAERGVHGDVLLVATEGTLLLQVDSPDAEAGKKLEKVVAVHLLRFATKDDIEVSWRVSGEEPHVTFTAADLDSPK